MYDMSYKMHLLPIIMIIIIQKKGLNEVRVLEGANVVSEKAT